MEARKEPSYSKSAEYEGKRRSDCEVQTSSTQLREALGLGAC